MKDASTFLDAPFRPRSLCVQSKRNLRKRKPYESQNVICVCCWRWKSLSIVWTRDVNHCGLRRMRWSLRRPKLPNPSQKDPPCLVLGLKTIEPVINRIMVEEYCLILFSLRMIEYFLFCSLISYRGTKIMWREWKYNAIKKISYLSVDAVQKRNNCSFRRHPKMSIYLWKRDGSCLCQNAYITIQLLIRMVANWFQRTTIVMGQSCCSSVSHCQWN